MSDETKTGIKTSKASRGWIYGVGITALFAVSGALGYTLFSGKTADTDAPLTVVSTKTDQNRTERPASVTNAPSINAATLRFRGLDIDTSRTDARACLAFSKTLDGSRVIDDRAYVQVDPQTPISLEVEDRRLCVLGLDEDQTYTVTVRPGYTSLDGTELTDAVTESVVFSPKPALVGFVGDGIILPRSNAATIGVRAVNAPKTKLTLYRVNHRALFETNPNDGETAVEGNWNWNGEAWQTRVQIHEDVIDTSGRTNATVEVAYPLAGIIDAQGAGAYIIEVKRDAEDDENRVATSWRWLYVTDLALTAYRSEDALSVTVRSIESAQTQAGVKLTLIARNNDILAEGTTDAQGHARFPGEALRGRDAQAPKMVMAYAGGDDFAALDLARSPLDLTAYDVTGRDVGGAVDAFLYTERGVYRPGETVHLMALIRSDTGRAMFDRPATLSLFKPDGSLFSERRIDPTDLAGALQQDWTLPKDAPRGRWTATVSLDALGTVGSVRFAVEDFVPEQLRLDVRADASPLRLGEPREISVAADFLYGAKGRGLDAELEARIQVDPKPFADYADYTFGDASETFREQLVRLGDGVTSDDGLFTATIDLAGDEYASASPLRLFTTAGVAEPSGRYVRDSLFLPLRSRDIYVGFKPAFEGGYAPRGQASEIDLIAVGRDGAAMNAEATFTLIRERYDYDWYREDGRWRYRYDRRDQTLETGSIALTAAQPVRFSRPLDYGQYRLQITTDAGETSSFQFGVGWRRSGTDNAAPDRIGLGLSQPTVEAGDTISLTVNSPFAGTGELVIAGRTVRRVQTILIPEGASDIRLPLSRDLASDVYAMLTVYTPGEVEQPRRAVGMVHIPLDRAAQTLSVSLDTPDLIRPRTQQPVVVKVAGLANAEGYISLAAVDSGILQITDYAPPNPEAHYFGKRAFALDVFDDYSRMLAPFFGPDRVGGDTLGGAGLAVVPTKTVSLFEGPISVKNGKAEITLNIPDFQGELTLMAVAWSERAVGSASTQMVVRDPVTSQLSLPRFLAPGDTAVATVSIDNIDGQSGAYVTKLTRAGMSLGEKPLDLVKGERGELNLPIEAGDVGISTYAIATTGPNFDIARDYNIQTRAAAMPVTRSRFVKLDAGERFALDLSADERGLLQSTISRSISAAFTAGLNPQPLLASLHRYPYGCTEQTVSTAMPLLLSESVGSLPNMTARSREAEIQNAVDRLLARQGTDGAIGLWRADDGSASPYVQLYATDFLLSADKAGYAVPRAAKRKLVDATKRLTRLDGGSRLQLNYQFGLNERSPNYERRAAERAAYAHALLARFDETAKSDLIYLHDQFADKMTDSIALTQLGSALSAFGETRRAADSFAKAAERLSEDGPTYFDSPVRNAAALLALGNGLTDAQQSDFIRVLADADPTRLNTHESAWVLRAIAGQSSQGVPFDGDVAWRTSGNIAQLGNVQSGMEIVNTEDNPVWLQLTVSGQPDGPMTAQSNGVRLSKSLFTMDGRALTAASLSRGERAIIALEAKPTTSRSAMWVMADLLPAGFEIETVLTSADAGDKGAFAWLGDLSELDLKEARDDRFIASWQSSRYNNETRRMAYIVRAVTEGDFAFPGAYVEDMYRPSRNAATAGQRLTVTGAPKL